MPALLTEAVQRNRFDFVHFLDAQGRLVASSSNELHDPSSKPAAMTTQQRDTPMLAGTLRTTSAKAFRRLLRDTDCRRLAEWLNRDCLCVSLDRAALQRELTGETSGAELYRLIADSRPHLFADSAVFVGAAQVERMAQIVAAVERVVALPAYRQRALAYAPASAAFAPKAAGVFLGYDFHLGATGDSHHGARGAQLIEINTNAGGAMLNVTLARAQQACCESMTHMLPDLAGAAAPEEAFVAMFRSEWQAERDAAPLRSIAIVDTEPETQYLYPEFVLFRRLFERHGIAAFICDPAQLRFDGSALWHAETKIDLVYNRLTDFALDAPEHAALRAAYLTRAVVLTPHPRAHALYADKRNLVALTDAVFLEGIGVDAATREVLLSGIPRTEIVCRIDAEALWARRKKLFFKPASGYGSRAAYRGDKLTRRVFDEILDGNYVAQALVAPSERRVEVDAEAVGLKLDLRNYVYRGYVQLISARLYQGQTTNFRTPGGGFAPVLTVPCSKL